MKSIIGRPDFVTSRTLRHANAHCTVAMSIQMVYVATGQEPGVIDAAFGTLMITTQ